VQVQVNTGHFIDGNVALATEVEATVTAVLAHFAERLTRVEVHISDENSDKKSGARDKRCVVESRPRGLQPIVVSHQAAEVSQAVDGAAEKMKHALESAFGRLDGR
jgi:hypothetical protein